MVSPSRRVAPSSFETGGDEAARGGSAARAAVLSARSFVPTGLDLGWRLADAAGERRLGGRPARGRAIAIGFACCAEAREGGGVWSSRGGLRALAEDGCSAAISGAGAEALGGGAVIEAGGGAACSSGGGVRALAGGDWSAVNCGGSGGAGDEGGGGEGSRSSLGGACAVAEGD
jgi:hypothetical protein